ncbi:MAG: tetratricopeptide repeat protein [Acidobacteriota bacterium]|nr:tetratricopeptide repeat protein [Acidobacteriota bacterium]
MTNVHVTVCKVRAAKRAKAVCLALVLPLCLGTTCTSYAQDATGTDLRLGNQAMREGHPDRAVEYFQSAVAGAPKLAEAYLNLGLADEQLGRQNEAADAFTRALHLKPALAGANLFLGIADYRLNRLDAATKALHAEVERSPRSPKAWMWLGLSYLAQNKPEEAAAALDKAGTLDPNDLDIMYHRGRAHLLVSKDAYEGMFKAGPDFWRVHQVLAEAYQESDRHSDAVTEYKMAIKAAPREPGLHDRLGDELWKNGSLDEADQAFADELKLDPHSITALYHLGRLRVTRTDRGQVADGVELLKQALAQDPSMAQVEYYLGRGTAQLDQNEDAIRHYESAIKGDPDGDVAQQSYYQLAHLYRQAKRPEDAKLALDNFTRLKKQADLDQKHKFENRLNPDAELAEKQTATP